MQYDPATPVAVFLGPSLDRREAAQILPANYYPPVRLGDVYRLLASGVRMVVIVDGVFHATTPVWPREILAALRKNIVVVGGSSMGALRAAEVSRFGMIGRGRIYEWYRDGLIDGDDEVALLHADASMNFRALSEPLVNIRHNLGRAVRRGLISDDQERSLIEESKRLPFTERSYETLLAGRACSRLPAETAEGLARFLTRDAADLKREDAIDVLRFCAGRLSPAGGASNDASGRFDRKPGPPPDDGFATAETLWRGVYRDGKLLRAESFLQQLQQDPQRLAECWQQASSRFFLTRWLCEQQDCTGEAYESRLSRHWQSKYAHQQSPEWLRHNGLTREEFEREARQLAAIDWLLDQDPEQLGVPFEEHRQCADALAKWFSTSAGAAGPDLLREAARTCYVADWARRHGVTCPAEVETEFIESWERGQEIDSRSCWLTSLGLEEPAYRRVWSQRALYWWIVNQGPHFFGHDDWSFESAVLREYQVAGLPATPVPAETEVSP